MLEQELAATDRAGGPSKSDRREAATRVQRPHHASEPAEVYSCDEGAGAGQGQEVAGERCVCIFGRRAAWRAWEGRARFLYASLRVSLLDMWRSIRWSRAFYPDVLACFLGMAERRWGGGLWGCRVRGWVRATDWQGRRG